MKPTGSKSLAATVRKPSKDPGLKSGKVVQSCIFGPSGKHSVSPPTAALLIESMKKGLPMAELK